MSRTVDGVCARVQHVAEHDVIDLTGKTALVTGAAAEPELAAVLAEGQRRHVEGAGRIVGLLGGLGALGSLDPEDARETLAAATDIRFALVLRESYGWSLDRLENWMAAASRALFLDQPS